MKILVQWAARTTPQGWMEYPAVDWAILPAADVAALCVQGVVFNADRYAVEARNDGSVVVWAEVNGPLSGQRLRVVRFRPLAPDLRHGGAYNTATTQTIYTSDPIVSLMNTEYGPWIGRPQPGVRWLEGRPMADGLWQAHQDAQYPRSWREWTDGVPADLLRDGRLVSQRRRGLYKPSTHTITYYLNNIARANGAVTANFELALDLVPAGLSLVAETQINQNGVIVVAGTTDVNQPNSASWPNGLYRCQLDCQTVNSDVTYGLLPLGAQLPLGGFWRADGTLTTQLERYSQIEPAFTFSGIRTASYNGAWTAGTAADRYCVSIAADRPTGHGNANITFEVGEPDDFVDGPWTSVSNVDACFFGGGP